MVDTATKPANSSPYTGGPYTGGPYTGGPYTGGGALVLRCCGPSRVGQIVRLKSDKCTIGSNPGCTLRLRARGVKPLHCLILRGRAETVIRRWASDTRLNGQPFSDAPLLVGDRLSIGPIEFEVLDPSVQPPTEGESLDHVRDDSPDEVQRKEVRQLPDLDQLATRLRLSNRQGRRRVRQMIEHLRRARKEITQLQDSRAVDTQRSNAAELEKKRKTLEKVQRRWENARAEAESQLKERAGQLDDQMTELEAERAQLRRRESEWEASRGEAETQLAARAEQIDTREAELDARLAEAPRPLPPADHSSQQQEQAASTPPSSESRAEGPSREAPAHSEEIFRRLAVGLPVPAAGKPQLEPEPELAATPAPESQPVPQIFGGRLARKWPEMSDSADDNDESVDQYMARLLERVRGATGDHPSDDPPESPPRETGSVKSAEPTTATEMAGTSGESSPPFSSKEEKEIGEPPEQEPVEMSPRRAAPERQENLRAMRELANASAQTAIHRHMRSRILSAGYAKLAVMSLGLLGGTASIWIWASGAPSPVALAAAVVGFAVAAFFGVWYALLVGQLIFGPSDHPMDGPQQDAEPTDEPSEAPEEDLSAEPKKKGPSPNKMLKSGEVYALVDGIPGPGTAREPSAGKPSSEPPNAEPTTENNATEPEEREPG